MIISRHRRRLWAPEGKILLRESFMCRPPGGGGAGAIVALSNDNIQSSSIDPSTSGLTMQFNSDGTITYAQNDTVDDGPVNFRWFSTGGAGALYWVRCSPIAGTLSSGTTGVWLALTSNRAFTVTRSSPAGTKSCTATFEIASDAAGTTVVATASIALTAIVNP